MGRHQVPSKHQRMSEGSRRGDIPKVRQEREEEALDKERQHKKCRIASAHKLLRIGGSVHGPIEIDADNPPNVAKRMIKGEMA